MNEQTSFPKDKLSIVLFEGIADTAIKTFSKAGYNNVRLLSHSQSGAELTKTLKTAHIVGVRSRTQLTAEVIAAAPKLMAVGCFCIGTNQVDLETAAHQGVPVFNAPHSNTRSVAELVIAEAVMLYRGIPDKNRAAHEGRWLKSASGSHELRGRTLGIVGYGHIGSQVSVLAEAFGMRVLYHDVMPKLPMGNATQLDSLEELLAQSDIVTLHVPQAKDTENLMSAERVQQMRHGAILLNLSRGNVVDLDALKAGLVTGRLLGAAVDVFPTEPKSNQDEFHSPLRDVPNVILTPHIGGSTQEAQRNIGVEVATKLTKYSDLGRTIGAVNFPEISLVPHLGVNRVLHIHKNQPGMLSAINHVQAESNANVVAQYLQTTNDIGYVVMDIEGAHASELKQQLTGLEGTIRCRLLY